MEDQIIKIPSFSYERKIPTTIDEAMEEIDRRIMITGQTNFGKVNARVIFRELLEDFVKGLENRSTIHIL
jgi:hypothetical protein